MFRMLWETGNQLLPLLQWIKKTLQTKDPPFGPCSALLCLWICVDGPLWQVGSIQSNKGKKIFNIHELRLYHVVIHTLFISQDVASLPDVLFDVLPERKLYPLPDVLIYTLLTSVLGRVVSFLLIICDKNVVSLLQDISFQWCGYCQKICNYLWMCIYSSWILIVVHFLTQPSKQLPSVHS